MKSFLSSRILSVAVVGLLLAICPTITWAENSASTPVAAATPSPAKDAAKTTAPVSDNKQTAQPSADSVLTDDSAQTANAGWMMLGIAITFIVCWLLSGLHPLGLIVGVDGRYSNSQFQVALWFFIVIASYIALFARRWHNGMLGGIEIPSHLLLLSGMSAFTYATAKGITTSKVNDALDQGKPNPKPTAETPDILRDLTHSDTPPPAAPVAPAGGVAVAPVAPAAAVVAAVAVPGGGGAVVAAAPAVGGPGQPANGASPKKKILRGGLDLGDTQMVMVTLLAAANYTIAFFYFLGSSSAIAHGSVKLPDVDITILSAFGLGQGAYLAKKAVGNPGQS